MARHRAGPWLIQFLDLTSARFDAVRAYHNATRPFDSPHQTLIELVMLGLAADPLSTTLRIAKQAAYTESSRRARMGLAAALRKLAVELEVTPSKGEHDPVSEGSYVPGGSR